MEPSNIVDLRSDTVTRPSAEMRAAMMTAEVGDDVWGDDPTVNRLQEFATELSGKEAALFVPSGTMANQIAVRCWTSPGDEVLMEQGAHPYNYEAAGMAAISGVQVRAIAGTNGLLNPSDVEACIRPSDPHFAPATLVVVENTSNRGGGTVYPQAVLDSICSMARGRGLKSHLDGARVFNAVVAQGSTLSSISAGFDSVTFCLSKGLGAPVGSILCGPADMIETGRRVRKMLGGGMRQAGFLAAAGEFALKHNVERLQLDHDNAAYLSQGLQNCGLDSQVPETNMVYFEYERAQWCVDELAKAGVWAAAAGPCTVRMVTHLDVDRVGIERALSAVKAILA
jgi:threonine aldolase